MPDGGIAKACFPLLGGRGCVTCFRQTGGLKSVSTLKYLLRLPSLWPRAKQNSPASAHQQLLWHFIPSSSCSAFGTAR